MAGRTFGVAKAATIVAVPVLAADGRGSWDRLIAAVQWYKITSPSSW